jgi:hypothetical protein
LTIDDGGLAINEERAMIDVYGSPANAARWSLKMKNGG